VFGRLIGGSDIRVGVVSIGHADRFDDASGVMYCFSHTYHCSCFHRTAAKTNFSCECLVVFIAVAWGLVWWDVLLCSQVESFQTFGGTH
jgi:hypothetical protein